jgi:GNAT superfamily N-acetyltransferase
MFEVRTAAGTDAAAIAALMTQLGSPCSGDDAAARLGYWLADPMSRVLVAEHEGLVIGCLLMHAVPYLERTGRWARIESLVIDESARGTEVDRALLRTAENVARQWECLLMEVTQCPHPPEGSCLLPAHGLYRRVQPVRAIPQGTRLTASGLPPRPPSSVHLCISGLGALWRRRGSCCGASGCLLDRCFLRRVPAGLVHPALRQ